MRYTDIPGYFGYGKLYEQIMNEIPNNETIIEIGSFKGRSTSYLIELANKSNKNINIVCIDHFLGSTEHHNEKNLFNDFQENITRLEYKYPFVVLKGSSLDISQFIPDGSVYACMIDGSHDYMSVKNDIINYLTKIKSGGLLCGDDYDFPGVLKAVGETLTEVIIEPRYGNCTVDIYAGNYWYKRIC